MTHGNPFRTLFFIVATLIAAVVLMSFAPAVHVAHADEVAPQATISADVLNVRGGPGTAYPVVSQAKAGQTYPVSGKSADGKWFVIDLKGKQGWVLGQYVKASGTLDGVAVVKAPAVPKAAAKAAAAPRSSPPGFFGYGVQISPGGDRGAAIGAVKGLGFNWVKVQLPWREFENAGPGARNWPDDVVGDLNGNGLQILASIVKAPNWARNPAYNYAEEGPPADPNTYASFVGEFARRYCGRVQAIEVWNEQNINGEWGNEPPDPARYMQLLKAAYGAIKNNCRDMIVVSGALTPAGNVTIDGQWRALDDQAYLKAMYRYGLARYSDAIGVHPSGYNVSPDVGWQQACAFISEQGSQFRGACDSPHPSWSFRSTMEGYHNIMVANGDGRKRLWPTEFGWAAGGALHPAYKYADDNTLDEQAAWTVRALQMMRNWGFVGPAFLWNLNYRMTDPGTERAQWGILDANGGALPAYNALKDARNNGTLP